VSETGEDGCGCVTMVVLFVVGATALKLAWVALAWVWGL